MQAWPTPTDFTTLHQFLGVASFYRRYVHKFDVAAPLHSLTQKGISFEWTSVHDKAFSILKFKLTQSPILAYPEFAPGSPPFVLQTDALAVGLGAVSEQGGNVMAYAS